MLPVMFENSWVPQQYFDDFLNTDFMPRANTTAPAVNAREDQKAYTMELAAPGIKKEYCRVAINDEGQFTIAIGPIHLSGLAIAAIVGIFINAILPSRINS